MPEDTLCDTCRECHEVEERELPPPQANNVIPIALTQGPLPNAELVTPACCVTGPATRTNNSSPTLGGAGRPVGRSGRSRVSTPDEIGPTPTKRDATTTRPLITPTSAARKTDRPAERDRRPDHHGNPRRRQPPRSHPTRPSRTRPDATVWLRGVLGELSLPNEHRTETGASERSIGHPSCPAIFTPGSRHRDPP